VEIEKLLSALHETISFLQSSQSSNWTSMSVEDIIQQLESEIVKAKNSQPIDPKLLAILFAPTGAIQETSIHNGWGDEFLRISEIIDQFTLNG
jgi:hypothetical protein